MPILYLSQFRFPNVQLFSVPTPTAQHALPNYFTPKFHANNKNQTLLLKLTGKFNFYIIKIKIVSHK